MKVLALEIRDRATFIPVLAIEMKPDNQKQRNLLGRAGYGSSRLIQVIQIQGGSGESHCDPYDWSGGMRTMGVAHNYIERKFDELNDGDVIDVEFILGETKSKKASEFEQEDS